MEHVAAGAGASGCWDTVVAKALVGGESPELAAAAIPKPWTVSRLVLCQQSHVSSGLVAFVKVASLQGLGFVCFVLRYSLGIVEAWQKEGNSLQKN